jgi:hypothetical protein
VVLVVVGAGAVVLVVVGTGRRVVVDAGRVVVVGRTTARVRRSGRRTVCEVPAHALTAATSVSATARPVR